MPLRRVAIVTGGASGLGQAIGQRLSHQGHPIGVLDVDGDAAERQAAALRTSGGEAIAVAADVADRAAIDAAFGRVRTSLGPIAILVTSAAVSGFVAFKDLTREQWAQSLAINLTGTFDCVQAAIGDMVAAQWGRIVTISSSAGQTGSMRQAHYSASKGGVIALTKTVALEFASLGITANTIPPFSVDTPMLRAAQDSGLIPSSDLLAKAIPVGRIGTSEEIAAMCGFLCSEDASYVTGQVIGVNGGAVR
jgi:2-hydroxycyclohexanecarboxyl-CoA dehydrogenase